MPYISKVYRPHFASITAENNAIATTIDTKELWKQVVTFEENSPSFGALPDYTNNHITIMRAGQYFVHCSMSFTGALANDTFEMEARCNSGATRHLSLHTERKTGQPADVGSASFGGIVTFNLLDTIELWVRNLTTDNNVTLKDFTLSLHEIFPA